MCVDQTGSGQVKLPQFSSAIIGWAFLTIWRPIHLHMNGYAPWRYLWQHNVGMNVSIITAVVIKFPTLSYVSEQLWTQFSHVTWAFPQYDFSYPSLSQYCHSNCIMEPNQVWIDFLDGKTRYLTESLKLLKERERENKKGAEMHDVREVSFSCMTRLHSWSFYLTYVMPWS